MARETRAVELPSGLKVEIVIKWSFDEYLQIEGQNTQIAKTLNFSDNTATLDHDAPRSMTLKTIMLALRKITDAAGNELPVNLTTVAEMEVEDGIALRDAVNEIQLSSKKG